MTTALIIYAGGFFAVSTILAWRDVLGVDARDAYWIALLWPVVLLLVVPLVLLEGCGWHVDIGRPPEHLKNWGMRKAEAWPRSWAARCPWLELRVWCTR